MIEDVEEPGGERKCGRPGHAVSLEGEAEAKSDEDDADILHRVIGEQPLEIMLHQGVEHAHHAGRAGKHEEEHAPPPGWLAEQIKYDPYESVDGDLGHYAAHQGRDMAGRGRMCERQPHV